MASVMPNQLWPELKSLLGLPDRVVALDLRIRVDEIAQCTVTYYPEAHAFEPITKRFRLEELPPDQPVQGCAQPTRS